MQHRSLPNFVKGGRWVFLCLGRPGLGGMYLEFVTAVPVLSRFVGACFRRRTDVFQPLLFFVHFENGRVEGLLIGQGIMYTRVSKGICIPQEHFEDRSRTI